MNNANRAAYPLQLQEGETSEGITKHGAADGLTKREYFAGLALQGLASDPEFGGDAEDAAIMACDYADELLAQLERTK